MSDENEKKTSEQQESPYLTNKEAADYLRLQTRTLDNLRWIGTGPKFRKHGGRIVYHIDDLEAWSEKRLRISTSGLTDED
ncbi:MAG: DNA-binding protein [Methyloligella sp.]|nr:MAG: DNA-binding protein [Methyloligella sp.]